MKNNILSLNEEIRRIKSLFTEERMFGNLVEDVGVTSDTKDNQGVTTNVPEGFVELTDAKKKEIDADPADAIEFYIKKDIDGKSYIQRLSFEKIKIKVGALDKVKAGRDLNVVKTLIKNDAGVPTEVYTDQPITFMTKKEGQAIKKAIKQDVKQDKGVIDDNIDSCTEHLKSMYRVWKKGGGSGELEDFAFTDEDYKSAERCMANFYNRFEKDDNIISKIGVSREDVMRMIKSFQAEGKIGDYRAGGSQVSRGVEGEKYTVENNRGSKLGIIKKITGNQYKFNGVRGMIFVEKRNGILQFKPFVLGPIFKALNLNIDTNTVTVVEGGDNNAIFRVK